MFVISLRKTPAHPPKTDFCPTDGQALSHHLDECGWKSPRTSQSIGACPKGDRQFSEPMANLRFRITFSVLLVVLRKTLFSSAETHRRWKPSTPSLLFSFLRSLRQAAASP
ncbi:MAG: hypothetical protein DVB23_001204 [Verrucomicrobia bacterium]|nr:MAG: hypothetical protein DVB23_001204 [Verrucomicrobiota bacterium]